MTGQEQAAGRRRQRLPGGFGAESRGFDGKVSKIVPGAPDLSHSDGCYFPQILYNSPEPVRSSPGREPEPRGRMGENQTRRGEKER